MNAFRSRVTLVSVSGNMKKYRCGHAVKTRKEYVIKILKKLCSFVLEKTLLLCSV